MTSPFARLHCYSQDGAANLHLSQKRDIRLVRSTSPAEGTRRKTTLIDVIKRHEGVIFGIASSRLMQTSEINHRRDASTAYMSRSVRPPTESIPVSIDFSQVHTENTSLSQSTESAPLSGELEVYGASSSTQCFFRLSRCRVYFPSGI
jgi:hypothetical protein